MDTPCGISKIETIDTGRQWHMIFNILEELNIKCVNIVKRTIIGINNWPTNCKMNKELLMMC